MFGEAILDRLHNDLEEEVRRTITNTSIDPATELSKEKTKRGQTVWTGPGFNKPLESAFRTLSWQQIPFSYNSKEWRALYNKRVSVERVFGRLKTYRKLNAIRTRRMPKVWLHVALSLLAMNAAAVVNVASGNVRKCVA